MLEWGGMSIGHTVCVLVVIRTLDIRRSEGLRQSHLAPSLADADHPKISPTENDGKKVLERLRTATDPLSISRIIGEIEGP